MFTNISLSYLKNFNLLYCKYVNNKWRSNYFLLYFSNWLFFIWSRILREITRILTKLAIKKTDWNLWLLISFEDFNISEIDEFSDKLSALRIFCHTTFYTTFNSATISTISTSSTPSLMLCPITLSIAIEKHSPTEHNTIIPVLNCTRFFTTHFRLRVLRKYLSRQGVNFAP